MYEIRPPAGHPYAGWRRRGVARLVDLALALVPALVLFSLLPARRIGVLPRIDTLALLIAPSLLIAVVFILFGSTPGKRMLSLRVVGLDGERPGIDARARRELVGRLLIEELLAPVTLGASLIGYLWPLGSARGQAWHDRVGRTVELRSDVALEPATPAPGALIAFTAALQARPLADCAVRARPAPGGAEIAPFLPRATAWVIDYLLLWTILTVLIGPIAVIIGSIPTDGSKPSQGQSQALSVLILGGFIVLSAAYRAITTLRGGRTLGKAALGLRVVGRGGDRLHRKPALLRELVGRILLEDLGGLVFFLIFPITTIMALADPLGRSIHDRIGTTLVVRDARTEAP